MKLSMEYLKNRRELVTASCGCIKQNDGMVAACAKHLDEGKAFNSSNFDWMNK